MCTYFNNTSESKRFDLRPHPDFHIKYHQSFLPVMSWLVYFLLGEQIGGINRSY